MTDWFRSWHGAPTDPKWRLIARRAAVRPGEVWSVVSFLWDRASQAADRGSVAGFDCELIAEVFGYEPDEVERIIAALTDKGVLADGRIAAWEKYQPKREDGAAERAKAWREQKRALESAAAETRTQSNARERPEADTESEKIDKPTAQHPEPASCAAPSYDGLLDLLLEANGVQGFRNERSPGLINLGPVLALIHGGLDLRLDILPAIRSKPNPKAGGWKYFDGQIREFAQQRRSALSLSFRPTPAATPPPLAPTQSEVFRIIEENAANGQNTADSGGFQPALEHVRSERSG